jgi:predicted metalloprotease with PDZ domain
MIAHEMFHAWNARRLRPAELVPCDFFHPQRSRSLWITEGFAEYYAHRTLRAIGRWSRARYLERVGEEATRAVVAARHGRTLEESSELAWQPPDDEASDPDSYYARGHLVALALDAAIRGASPHHSLDDVMRKLLLAAGPAGVLPIDAGVLARTVDEIAGASVGRQLIEWVSRPHETDKLAGALAAAGLQLVTEELPPRTTAGFSAAPEGDSLRVAAISLDGPAALAGLRVGDRIVLLDGGAPSSGWAETIAAKSPGVALLVEAVRATHRLALELSLQAQRPIGCHLIEIPAPPKVAALRDAWLGH